MTSERVTFRQFVESATASVVKLREKQRGTHALPSVRQDTRPTNQAISVSADGQSAKSFDCKNQLHKTVQVYGTFTGTVTVVGTIDGNDWRPVGGAAGIVTGPAIVYVPEALEALAIEGSSWSAGEAFAVMSGFNSQTI